MFEQAVAQLNWAAAVEEEGGLSYSWTEQETIVPCLRSFLGAPPGKFPINPRLLARYLLISCYCHLNQLLEAKVALEGLEVIAEKQTTEIAKRLLAAARTEYATCQEQLKGVCNISEEKKIRKMKKVKKTKSLQKQCLFL